MFLIVVLNVLKSFERCMDFGFAIFLILLLVRKRHLFLDLRHVRIPAYHITLQKDRFLFNLFKLSILWLAAWHFGETVYYYAIYVQDKMMVVHHITTISVAAFIWYLELYNGYVAIPLLGHYIVTLWPMGLVYSAYASLYVAVVCVGFLLWGFGHFEHVKGAERRAIKAFVVIIILHTLNLVEFGFTTKKICQDQYWRLAMYIFGWSIGAFLLIIHYTPFRRNYLPYHVNSDGCHESVSRHKTVLLFLFDQPAQVVQ